MVVGEHEVNGAVVGVLCSFVVEEQLEVLKEAAPSADALEGRPHAPVAVQTDRVEVPPEREELAEDLGIPINVFLFEQHVVDLLEVCYQPLLALLVFFEVVS